MLNRAVLRLALVLTALTSSLLHAAEWHSVTTDQGKRIEIDRASVIAADGGRKVAWMRMVLPPEDASRQGYATIKVMSRYDCRADRYMTVKRVFLREDMTIVREEKMQGDDVAVQPGTADEKVYREICPAPGMAELKRVALQAASTMERAKSTGIIVRTAATDDKAIVEPKSDGAAKKPLVNIRPSLQKDSLKAEAAAALAALKADADKSGAKLNDAHAEPKLSGRAVSEQTLPAPERLNATVGKNHAAPAVEQPKLALAEPKPQPVAAVSRANHSGPAHEIHWSYEGETGPANWGKLKPEWKTCTAGERQSPIDIRDGVRVDQEPIKFDYKPSAVRIVDNGHTVQVNVAPGNKIMAMGREFELLQFHFHRPSEERVNGKLYEMVAHLVHKDAEGKLAVVAVLLDRGMDNPVIQTLWNNLPLERGVENSPSAAIDLPAFLPANRNYFAYMGSLTTPPCSEGVLWLVLQNPVEVSDEQVASFAQLYRNNARPIQQAKGRLIRESR